MGAPFILTLLSSDGYQVFAALHREYATMDEAIEGAKDDYLRRYGGNPSFRIYHADRDGSGYRHTLIEACFDEAKRRSFVALYKVVQGVWPRPDPIPEVPVLGDGDRAGLATGRRPDRTAAFRAQG